VSTLKVPDIYPVQNSQKTIREVKLFSYDTQVSLSMSAKYGREIIYPETEKGLSQRR